MFTQFFIVIIALLSLVSALLVGSYFWAFCAMVMLLGGIHLIYKLKTGKDIGDK
ncbi:hypothetical protein SAMN05216262_12517 [Colwellia chukchiensis]|uniref:Uncharacterized protein n=1 Tax=Colwellia chukchiensis TaxID=641665 RepID=A0A1H7TFY8_9GAMM|nr:hypothetical protein [Colwellia chukchiensis]SEL83751.1 hypothetical protein SAMN05216262_12517 [Colwellia chukchiensis]